MGEGGQIFYARQLQRVHHFDDRAERSFLVGLKRERWLFASAVKSRTAVSSSSTRDGLAVQLDLIVLAVTLTIACSVSSRRFRRGLRFRQIDLHFRLIFFESRRDDEKD